LLLLLVAAGTGRFGKQRQSSNRMPIDFVVFSNGCRVEKEKTLFYATLEKLYLAKPHLMV
jgi:hypothetical protein